MNKCSKIAPLIDALVSGEATDDEREIVMQHIEQCDECRYMYETLCEIENGLRYCVEPPEDFTKNVMDAVRSSGVKHSRPSAVKRHLKKYTVRYAAAAACFLLVSAVAVKLILGDGFNAKNDSSVMFGTDNNGAMATESSGAAADWDADTGDSPESYESDEYSNDNAYTYDSNMMQYAPGENTENDSAASQNSAASTEAKAEKIRSVQDEYDISVIIYGELPEILEGAEQTQYDGFSAIEISVDTAAKLMDMGYDYEIAGEEENSAVVIYIP